MKREVRVLRYEARSCGPSSDSLAFESAKQLADYCVDCHFLPSCEHQALIFTVEWTGARPGANIGEDSAQWAFPANQVT